jgi:hypothetical protein
MRSKTDSYPTRSPDIPESLVEAALAFLRKNSEKIDKASDLSGATYESANLAMVRTFLEETGAKGDAPKLWKAVKARMDSDEKAETNGAEEAGGSAHGNAEVPESPDRQEEVARSVRELIDAHAPRTESPAIATERQGRLPFPEIMPVVEVPLEDRVSEWVMKAHRLIQEKIATVEWFPQPKPDRVVFEFVDANGKRFQMLYRDLKYLSGRTESQRRAFVQNLPDFVSRSVPSDSDPENFIPYAGWKE